MEILKGTAFSYHLTLQRLSPALPGTTQTSPISSICTGITLLSAQVRGWITQSPFVSHYISIFLPQTSKYPHSTYLRDISVRGGWDGGPCLRLLYFVFDSTAASGRTNLPRSARELCSHRPWGALSWIDTLLGQKKTTKTVSKWQYYRGANTVSLQTLYRTVTVF